MAAYPENPGSSGGRSRTRIIGTFSMTIASNFALHPTNRGIHIGDARLFFLLTSASKFSVEPNGGIFDVSPEKDHASPNVKWCVVIGQCHGNCAQHYPSARSFRRCRWRDVRLNRRATSPCFTCLCEKTFFAPVVQNWSCCCRVVGPSCSPAPTLKKWVCPLVVAWLTDSTLIT